MIGQGVLRECLLNSEVTSVLAIGRNPSGQSHPKLRDLVQRDLFDYRSIESQLAGFDACFFCLGVTSIGMSEAEYTRITHDLTLAAAHTLARLNPAMTFIYVSGVGADSSERGRVMWARVRGKLENTLLRLPIRTYIFRPAVVQPMHGIRSRVKWLQAVLSVIGPVLSLLRRSFPGQFTSTEAIGLAMLEIARHGYPKRILESRDINNAAARRTLQ